MRSSAAAMCDRYTITDKKTNKIADRFDALLSKNDSVADGLGRYNIQPRRCRRWS